MKKIIPALLIIPLFFLLGAGSPASNTYIVKKVIDGDTLKLSNGETVRLIGIDTPEAHDNEKARRDSERTGQDLATITKMGKEAKEFVKTLIEGKEVRLEFDMGKRDKFGRLLGYVYLTSTMPATNKIKGINGYFYITKDGYWNIYI